MSGIAFFNLSSTPTLCSPSASLSSSLPFLHKPSFLTLRTSRPSRSRFPKIFSFSSNDIKVGSTIEVDGFPWRVIEFLHVKPGKGAAFVRTKMRNFVTGNTVEKTFRAGSTIQQANVSKETKQFTYKDGSQFVFMDLDYICNTHVFHVKFVSQHLFGRPDHVRVTSNDQHVINIKTTYEETRLNDTDVDEKKKWLKEGMDCILLFWNGKVIDFDVPQNVKLTVVDVDPGLKGDTAQGGTKPATVDTGAVVNVPLFVNIGDTIVVDTRTGQYTSRA